MKIYNKAHINQKNRNGVIAIGNFDGIHLGHQKVINEAKQKAKIKKLPFGVMTFEPVPIKLATQMSALLSMSCKITPHTFIGPQQACRCYSKCTCNVNRNIVALTANRLISPRNILRVNIC